MAVNEVFQSSMAVSAEQVFLENRVWVGGGMVFGIPDRLALLAQDYRQAVAHFLTRGLSNTDQQVRQQRR